MKANSAFGIWRLQAHSPRWPVVKAIVIEEFGGPEVLQLKEIPRPEPRAGELLVRVHAAGANPIDAGTRADGGWAGVTLPAILGCDISGVVEATGDGVSEFSPGDEVFYMAEFLNRAPGGYAEYNAVDAQLVAAKPPGLDHIEAAALPLAAGTAECVVGRRLEVQPGEWTLIHGASGGVGGYAVQIAKARGAQVIASASGAREDYLRGLGADAFVDYEVGNPFEIAAGTIGAHIDAVADLVGSGSVAQALPFVGEGGRIASIVELKGDLDLAIDRNIALHGVLVRPSRVLLEDLTRRVSLGELRATVDTVYTVNQVRAMHERLDSGHGRGKAILAMPILAERGPAARAL
ncbi:MAG: NADP-dependent oxidoreductase [Solirubrobacteraceae bacterium]